MTELLAEMGVKARQASFTLAQLTTTQKNEVLKQIALALEKNTTEIIKANQYDLEHATGLASKFVDRLTLDQGRILAMAEGEIGRASCRERV